MSHNRKWTKLKTEADRGESYKAHCQPGRVHLSKISWHPDIMPFHVHDIAQYIATRGASKRRYNQVRLVEVPADVIDRWIRANKKRQQ